MMVVIAAMFVAVSSGSVLAVDPAKPQPKPQILQRDWSIIKIIKPDLIIPGGYPELMCEGGKNIKGKVVNMGLAPAAASMLCITEWGYDKNNNYKWSALKTKEIPIKQIASKGSEPFSLDAWQNFGYGCLVGFYEIKADCKNQVIEANENNNTAIIDNRIK